MVTLNLVTVMGLTTDLENKWLYWMVRSYDGSELHRAPTADRISHGIYEVPICCNFLIVIIETLQITYLDVDLFIFVVYCE